MLFKAQVYNGTGKAEWFYKNIENKGDFITFLHGMKAQEKITGWDERSVQPA